MPEHHQGAVDAIGHIDLLHRGPVHLRVRLDGGDEFGDAPGGLLHLRQQRGDGERARHPLQARFQRRSGQRRRRPLAPGRDRPRRRRAAGRSSHSRATPCRASHTDRASSWSARASGSWTTAVRLDLAAQRVERGELLGRDLVTGQPGQARTASVWQASSSASTAREAAAAGLLTSCAKPAASVPRVTRDSRCRAVASMDRAVRYSPWMRCLPNGNQALTFSAQHFRGHPEHPPAGRSPAGREIDAVLIPGAEPPGPAARHVHPSHDGVLRTDMAHAGR